MFTNFLCIEAYFYPKDNNHIEINGLPQEMIRHYNEVTYSNNDKEIKSYNATHSTKSATHISF